jgi:signal transduction histidine kinase
LLPASIILGALVCVGAPAAYYLVQKPGLERTAEAYARNLAARLHDSSPALWAQHSYEDPEIVQTLLASGEILTIRVRGLSGDPIGEFAYTSARAGAWWNRNPPRGAAPVRFNGRVVGLLELGLARDGLLRTTAMVFGLATAVGVTLAAFIYWFPVSVGRAMEAEIRERTLAAQEAERRRIAYDLHDGIAQLIVSAKQHLDTCQDIWGTDRPRAASELVKGVDRLQRALTETRDVLTSLRPSSVEAAGLRGAIQALLTDTGRQQGWSTDLRDELGDRPLPFAVENAVFRITQEALSNAARHAAARHVSVELRRDGEGWIEASIGDDGRGFEMKASVEPTSGMGLESMRERARLLGGSVTIASAGRGTIVCARLPLNATATS